MKRVGSFKQALKPSSKSSKSTNNDVVNNNESTKMNASSSNGVSILGNANLPRFNGQSKPDFHLPKSISSFLKKGTLTRNKKDKNAQVLLQRNFCTYSISPRFCLPSSEHKMTNPFLFLLQNRDAEGGDFSFNSTLAPPMPPVAPTARLRRISSSTLSLSGRTKKKILTVRNSEFFHISMQNSTL